jgi:hypothetical protein
MKCESRGRYNVEYRTNRPFLICTTAVDSKGFRKRPVWCVIFCIPQLMPIDYVYLLGYMAQ